VDGHPPADDVGQHRVACLVVGDHALFLLRDHAVRLQARHHALEGVVEVDGRDRVAARACRADGGLVADVLQVSAGQAGSGTRDRVQIDGLVDGLVAHMHVEDLLAGEQVGR
jgi:hypothetical protein